MKKPGKRKFAERVLSFNSYLFSLFCFQLMLRAKKELPLISEEFELNRVVSTARL